MEKLPVSLDVLVEFCWHLRQQYPDPKKCGWPAVRSKKTSQHWKDIAIAYGWALDPALPWEQEFEEYSSLLRAALQAHAWGPEAEVFPSAAFINKAAKQLYKAHRQNAEIDRQRQERAEQDKLRPAGGSDIQHRCMRLLNYRGIGQVNPNNPYANRMDEILEWAKAEGLPTEPIQSKSVLREGVL